MRFLVFGSILHWLLTLVLCSLTHFVVEQEMESDFLQRSDAEESRASFAFVSLYGINLWRDGASCLKPGS